MIDINKAYRNRIGFPQNEEISFEKLEQILELSAKMIPFENLCIMNRNLRKLTKKNVADKILMRQEGGLCYELNTLLYFFLLENDFDTELVYGAVYNRETQSWSRTGRTHVLNIVTHEGQKFLVDTGFGGNLPLKPVPLNGDVVVSRNGEFRVQKTKSEYGEYIFELKLKDRDTDWRIGYVFDPVRPIEDIADLNLVQQIIAESPDSSFNKGHLMTKFTENGTVTLTDSSMTQRFNGDEIKEKVEWQAFIKLAKQHFGIEIK
ncbi:arylamine N-acetyltransferase [Bacillus sp. BRMEA1]|uniref:arylamine N-acetyltransferase family protein n=1 Tax=Neobacillus endophyticus TaxID=2738405 RepID=UPI001567AEEB|nr:arylamine N-acetyltransferase [Neobacillus endophyticus]NRD79525.1 arylamine N-acetyltransferase [Neobacillus endophyticus]